MSRSSALWLLAGLLASALSAGAKPNIVLFIADDHTATDCGAYGSSDVRTPNIDRLAREGLLFRRAFAGSPTCMPSRALQAVAEGRGLPRAGQVS